MTHETDQVHEAVRRARMLFSLLATPKLRLALAARLSGNQTDATGASLPPLDWLDESGQVDAALARETASALMSTISDRAILDAAQVSEMPADAGERMELSQRIVSIVFERFARSQTLSEPELNAGIAMFCRDFALIRRDAVDSGFLERSADGAHYALRKSGRTDT